MTATRPSPTATKAPKSPAAGPTPPAGRCRLTLTIDGVDYDVRPAKPTKFGVIVVFRLARQGGPRRWIAETLEGQKCSCEDFKYRRDGDGPKGGCKHLKAARAVGLL